MRLTIAIKDENGRLYSLPERYEFADDELDRLIGDFNDYCSARSEGTGRRGGAYRCHIGSEEKLLFLKFDEIAYIG